MKDTLSVITILLSLVVVMHFAFWLGVMHGKKTERDLINQAFRKEFPEVSKSLEKMEQITGTPFVCMSKEHKD